MLEKVKRRIQSCGDVDFDTYYLDYICSIQDRNIEREFRYFRSVNVLNPNSMQSIIEHTYREMRLLDSDN